MSRALPKYSKRRVAFAGGAAAVALSGTVIAGFALAGEDGQRAGTARTLAGPGTITCPDVTGKLPAIPASARAEVDRNLTLLQTQITEADQRLADTVGQGGPDFVQNAILGPLKDKRVATLDRIALSIGRTAAKPQGLEAFATCTLNTGGAQATPAPSQTSGGGGAGAGQGNGNGGNNGNGGGNTGVGTITCPDVTGKLPAIPASARAEVDRNLTLLQT
ncbi:hypothetical protein, partial [Streptomyces sp. NPDC056628]|uniref:hypothetical protein n=1 Tax=Streptomyces sp. NPDC056628 TaxID=3345882 RepID=UPI003686FDE7